MVEQPSGHTATESSRPLFLRTVILGSLALAAGIAVMRQLDQQSRRSFAGRLQARVITLAADQAAHVREIHARTGQRVASGEPLCVLQACAKQNELQARKETAERLAQEARRLNATAELEIHWRRRELQAEIFQTQLKLASLRQENLHLQVAQVAWREQLSVQTVFSDTDVAPTLFRSLSDSVSLLPEDRVQALLQEDAASAAAEATATQIALCEQRLLELRELEQSLERHIRLSLDIASAEQRHRDAVAALESVNETDEPLTVLSPGYGVIGEFRKQSGDSISIGDVLVQIVDDERRTVDVEVPSWAVVKFEPGQMVQLEFPGHEPRTGIVTTIPPQTIAAETSTGDATVKLTIAPHGKAWPQLAIGSRVLVYQP